MRLLTATVVRALLISLVLSVAFSGSGGAYQGGSDSEIREYDVQSIFPEASGGTDEFGRPVVMRLTIRALAGVGPEDLSPPFVAYVESGTITLRNAEGVVTELGAGHRVEIGADEAYLLRNMNNTSRPVTLLVLSQRGSCLIYQNAACMPFYLPYDHLCETPCRPDVTNALLFNYQDTRSRLWWPRISVDRVLAPANMRVESLDIGGDTALIRLYVRVEVGSVTASDGTVYAAGEEFVAQSRDAIVAGASGADLIVLRLAEPLDTD